MTLSPAEFPVSAILIEWYNKNKRELPWRQTHDPYKIWISEIILQQTRVNQGINYYHRFIERFDSVAKLAMAEEDEVLKYWQGLGYYSRARNLHKAARQIAEKHNGKFPDNYTEVRELPGIGDYTAAAICSFAYNQPFAAIDGNIYRVLSRIWGIETPIDSSTGKKEFSQLARNLVPQNHAGLHNQAIMEFGALHCTPAAPDCTNCPVLDFCCAFHTGRTSALPVKSKKKTTKNRYFNYLYIKHGNTTFIHKRTAKDVWQNLYEFPLIETTHLPDIAELTNSHEFISLFENTPTVTVTKTTNPMKHVLSHRVIYAQFISIAIDQPNEKILSDFIQVPCEELDKFAISRLTELFLESL